MVTRIALALAFSTLIPSPVRAVAAHPLHTTLTDLTIDAAHHTVRAVVRVFADDVSAALTHRAGGHSASKAMASDTEASAYILSTVAATNRTTPIALRACGVKRNGDLLWVCIEGDVSGDTKGLSLKNAVLCELFSDQVNIVQVTAAMGASPRSVLFTRGDGAKPLL